ncbi:heat shock factor 2-binding protein isoform 6-T6 [Pluvialis apricaria]
MWRRAGLAGDAQKAETKEEFVKVRRRDLERLTTEVMQLRDFLPKIVNGDILGTFQKLDAIESNMEKKEEEIEQLKMDCEHFRARLETAQADCMREKKSKAAKFFTITAQTMESFVKSLSEDMKQQDLDSDENQFVLALAGIVTNVAALACGREFLVSSSRELLDTMMHLLGDMKPGLCTKFKVLMLMSLYNVSINLKGLKYISENPGFIPLLWWLLNAWLGAAAFWKMQWTLHPVPDTKKRRALHALGNFSAARSHQQRLLLFPNISFLFFLFHFLAALQRTEGNPREKTDYI